MPNIQVRAEHRLALLEEHRIWSNSLPRTPGQIGGSIHTLVQGSPIHVPGEITPYSDFDDFRYTDVDQAFVDYLKQRRFPFREN